MHVASLTLFEGPAPDYDEFRDHIGPAASPGAALPPEAALRAVRPGAAQVGRRSPLQPRTTTCATPPCPSPAPRSSCASSPRGSSRSASTARSRMWEMWLVDGVEGGRFAIVAKTHHCARRRRLGRRHHHRPLRHRRPRPETGPSPRPGRRAPSRATRRCWRRRSSSARRTPAEMVRGARAVFRAPRQAARAGVDALEAAGAFARTTPGGARLAVQRRDRALPPPGRRPRRPRPFKEIKNELGGTVNDVVLAAVAGALGRYLRARGHSTQRARAAGDGPDQRSDRGRARGPRQPRVVVHGAAARVRGGPGRAPAARRARRWATSRSPSRPWARR